MVKKFVGKVLADGHLSVPKEIAGEVGKEFEVILSSVGKESLYDLTEKIAEQKGFRGYTEEDIERIIHESRGIRE